MPPEVSLIAAVAADGGIGHRGALLFRIREDLQHFKAITLGHPVVMGRRTWDSIGRPLPGRRNIVLTRDPVWHADGAERAGSWPGALALVGDVPRVCVVGGADLYALALPRADLLELTEVAAVRPADAWFPTWDRHAFREESRTTHTTADGLAYAFVTYRRATTPAA